MSIENYQNMLMEIKDKILNKELKYKNTIKVGIIPVVNQKF